MLLTGATGFVGNKLWAALHAAGHKVRCVTRDADSAARRWPERDWVEADIANAGDLARVMTGCLAAYYLVHSMGLSGSDFLREEVETARLFAREAEKARISRIVYLGGVEPQGKVSKHLRSRLLVGRALGSTAIPALELRAAMIVGAGSQSWTIVRDLAARLPVMVLPAWLESESEPVAIDDVIAALVAGLDVALEGNASYDLPGPERLSGRETLVRAAQTLGYSPPVTLEVPFLSIDLSTYWLKLISRADWSIARELVLGLRSDILARDASYWKLIGQTSLLTFEEAARLAAKEEGRVELKVSAACWSLSGAGNRSNQLVRNWVHSPPEAAMNELSTQDLAAQLWEEGDPSPELVSELYSIGDAAIGPLRELLSLRPNNVDDQRAQVVAGCLLGYLGDRESIPKLVELFRLQDTEVSDLPYGIGQLGTAAIEPLMEIIRDPSVEYEHRGEAMNAARWAALGDAEATNRFASTLREMLKELLEKAGGEPLSGDDDRLASELFYVLLDISDPADEPLLQGAIADGLLVDTFYTDEKIAQRFRDGPAENKPDFDEWMEVCADEYELTVAFAKLTENLSKTEVTDLVARAVESAVPNDLDDDDISEDFDDDRPIFPPSMFGLPYKRSTPKVGRNDPCWCGSGKKYKKCHLIEDEKVKIV